MYQQQYQPRGGLRRALGWHARRRNPAVWRPQPKLPFWARHPVVWVFKGLIKTIGVVLIVPFVAWKHPKLAPWCLIAWLWAMSAVLHLTPSGWQVLVASAAIGAPILYWQLGLPVWKLTRPRSARLRYRIGILASFITGVALLATAAAVPAMLIAPGYWLVWAPACAFATGWWGRHEQPEPEPEIVDDAPPVDPRVGLWDRRVAAKFGGAYLTDLLPIDGVPDAWTATVDLSSTDKTFDDLTAQGATAFIAARYKLPPTSVSIKAHGSNRHDLGTLMMFERNPLQAVQRFSGLSLDKSTGQIVVARCADGTPGCWQLWIPGWGACHGFIFGVTGAGKSGLLDVIFIESRHSGVVCPMLGDPHNGKSFPDWMDNLTVFTGKIPRIWAMLVGIERMLEYRKAMSGTETFVDDRGRTRRRGGGFTPTREDPLLLAVLDEWPKISSDPTYGPECVRIVAKIGEDGRKFGVAVIIVCQVPDVDKNGGDRSIRSMASGMNLAAFRTSDSVSGNIGIPVTLPIDPKDLPVKWPDGSTTAGLVYLARDDTAATPARCLFSPGQENGDELIEWATTGDLCPLPQKLAEVAGPLFTSWRQLLDISDEDVIAVGPDGEWIRPTDDKEDDADGDAGAPAKAGEKAQTAWEKIRAVLARKSYGATAPVLRDATGVKHNTVDTTLRRYEKAGKCHEVNGVWHLGAADQRQDERETAGAA